MYCETPIDLGNILTGAKIKPYLVGYNYDWTYRLYSIKANSDYTEFYLMCPLEGVKPIGKTLKEAVKNIDLMHEEEVFTQVDHSTFCEDDIPF